MDKRFTVGSKTGEEISVSYLLFADDTLSSFVKLKTGQRRHLKMLLIVFERVSGLLINLKKISQFLVNTVHVTQEVLGCNIGSLPTTFRS